MRKNRAQAPTRDKIRFYYELTGPLRWVASRLFGRFPMDFIVFAQ
jgi:hypothetical protein